MSLVHAEYLKLTRRKLYPIMVAILGLIVAVSAFFAVIFPQLIGEDDLLGVMPVFEKPDAFLFGVQQVVANTWFPLILAVIMLGSEFGGTVWAAALTRDSRKLRQIAARFLILVIASWAAISVAIAGWTVVVVTAVPGTGGLGVGEWVSVFGKVGLVQLTWIAIGLAAVATLRSVGPAIGAALAVYFIEPLVAMWDLYENISISAAANALFPVFPDGLIAEFIPGAGLSVFHAVSILVGWAAFGFVVAWWSLHRRDA